jgi:hypothetical protein
VGVQDEGALPVPKQPAKQAAAVQLPQQAAPELREKRKRPAPGALSNRNLEHAVYGEQQEEKGGGGKKRKQAGQAGAIEEKGPGPKPAPSRRSKLPATAEKCPQEAADTKRPRGRPPKANGAAGGAAAAEASRSRPSLGKQEWWAAGKPPTAAAATGAAAPPEELQQRRASQLVATGSKAGTPAGAAPASAKGRKGVKGAPPNSSRKVRSAAQDLFASQQAERDGHQAGRQPPAAERRAEPGNAGPADAETGLLHGPTAEPIQQQPQQRSPTPVAAAAMLEVSRPPSPVVREGGAEAEPSEQVCLGQGG